MALRWVCVMRGMSKPFFPLLRSRMALGSGRLLSALMATLCARESAAADKRSKRSISFLIILFDKCSDEFVGFRAKREAVHSSCQRAHAQPLRDIGQSSAHYLAAPAVEDLQLHFFEAHITR